MHVIPLHEPPTVALGSGCGTSLRYNISHTLPSISRLCINDSVCLQEYRNDGVV